MKKTLFFVFLVYIISLTNSQTGWFQQNSGTKNYLYSCYFLNDYTGYVSSKDGLIIKTTNGGTSWFTAYNNNIYDMYSVYFINNNTGWAGGFYDSAATVTNIIVKTTNGGLSWSNSFIDTIETTLNLYGDILFLNPLTGYLTGNKLKKSTNGGINWFVTLDRASTGVFFINNFTGWSGNFSSGISKTTNEGLTWVQQIIYIVHQYNADIYFINGQTGFCISGYFGVYGNLFTTTNSGLNWNAYSLPYRVTSITFANENTGYMLANNYSNQKFYRTTDAGLNWDMHNISTSRVLIKTFFSSVNTGWAIGDSGSIFKTTNGGVTIQIYPITSVIPNKFSLSQNYPNPFNPHTIIKFEIPQNAGTNSDHSVKLVIYDLLGMETVDLVSQVLKPGVYEIDFDGSNLPSGTYFYRLQAGDYSETKKMVLLR